MKNFWRTQHLTVAHLPTSTNQKLYQQCRFFTETKLKKYFPGSISTMIFEYGEEHAMNEDPAASLQKYKKFMSRFSEAAKNSNNTKSEMEKSDTSYESARSDVSRWLHSGMLMNCIEKYAVTAGELHDLNKHKPWIVHALECFNISRAVCDWDITIEQLQQLTQEQIKGIEYKLTGAALKEEVEKFVRTNMESSANTRRNGF